MGATHGHALADDVSSLHAVCTNECLPTASILCSLKSSPQKSQAVSPGYAQSKAQMNHLQIIS